MKKRSLLPAALLAGLYVLNRFWLIPDTTGELHRFLAWYGNDVLAGATMLLVLNGLLGEFQLPLVTGIFPATLFSFLCGCFWEFVTPLYLPRSVGDPWDLAAYWCGAMLFLLFRRLCQCRQHAQFQKC